MSNEARMLCVERDPKEVATKLGTESRQQNGKTFKYVLWGKELTFTDRPYDIDVRELRAFLIAASYKCTARIKALEKKNSELRDAALDGSIDHERVTASQGAISSYTERRRAYDSVLEQLADENIHKFLR